MAIKYNIKLNTPVVGIMSSHSVYLAPLILLNGYADPAQVL